MVEQIQYLGNALSSEFLKSSTLHWRNQQTMCGTIRNELTCLVWCYPARPLLLNAVTCSVLTVSFKVPYDDATLFWCVYFLPIKVQSISTRWPVSWPKLYTASLQNACTPKLDNKLTALRFACLPETLQWIFTGNRWLKGIYLNLNVQEVECGVPSWDLLWQPSTNYRIRGHGMYKCSCQ